MANYYQPNRFYLYIIIVFSNSKTVCAEINKMLVIKGNLDDEVIFAPPCGIKWYYIS